MLLSTFTLGGMRRRTRSLRLDMALFQRRPQNLLWVCFLSHPRTPRWLTHSAPFRLSEPLPWSDTGTSCRSIKTNHLVESWNGDYYWTISLSTFWIRLSSFSTALIPLCLKYSIHRCNHDGPLLCWISAFIRYSTIAYPTNTQERLSSSTTTRVGSWWLGVNCIQ